MLPFWSNLALNIISTAWPLLYLLFWKPLWIRNLKSPGKSGSARLPSGMKLGSYDVGNCQYLLFLTNSFRYCKWESSSPFLIGFVVVVEEIYTSMACDFGDIWVYNVCLLELADCCFSCTVTMIRKLFFHLLQGYSTSYGLWKISSCYLRYFRPLVWTRCLSLNFRFRLLLW